MAYALADVRSILDSDPWRGRFRREHDGGYSVMLPPEDFWRPLRDDTATWIVAWFAAIHEAGVTRPTVLDAARLVAVSQDAPDEPRYSGGIVQFARKAR